ncbi:hypothetical protein [Streptosporangium sp. NPDC001681]|uniref:hypothetical protein n=1 Tax=Streptosporangium sp. NPDC001681 TaxID=3154395 RepID=UPI00331C1B51
MVAYGGPGPIMRPARENRRPSTSHTHTKIGGKSVLVRGLNVPASTLSTPLAVPVVPGTRLRGGSVNAE